MTNAEVDRQLMEALEELHRLEIEEGWTDLEVIDAQRILGETAAWMRGFRPPASFEEAWGRIHHRRDDGRLRPPGFGGPDR